MLETPKSAKTPSTPGIPNSCTTSAILENGACTSVTFSPKIFSRSRASSSACASRSKLTSRPGWRAAVVPARVRLVLQAIDHAGVVHHLEIIEVPEHIHFALHLRRFPQHRGN